MEEKTTESFDCGIPAGVFCLWMALVLAGGLFWLHFFEFGRFAMDHGDWAREFIYYETARLTLAEGKLPWHIGQALGGTNRLLANMEVVLPTLPLLALMGTPAFVATSVLLGFLLGAAGVLAITWRFRLGAISMAALFLGIGFHGHLVARMGVGHFMWISLHLFPWFFLAVHGLLTNPGCRRSPIAAGLVMAGIVLMGGIHFVNWCLLFVILLTAFRRIPLQTLLLILGVMGLVAAVRYFPGIYTYRGYSNPFVTGYPDLSVVFAGLLLPHGPDFGGTPSLFGTRGTNLGWHEYSLYLGLVGTAILGAGVAGRFLPHSARNEPFHKADIPMAIVAAASIGHLYYPIHFLGVPHLSGERVSARIIALPMLWYFTLGCLALNSWVVGLPWRWRALVGILVVQFGTELYQFAGIWRPAAVRAQSVTWNPEVSAVFGVADARMYPLLFKGGLVMTLLAGVAAAWLAWSGRGRFPLARDSSHPVTSGPGRNAGENSTE